MKRAAASFTVLAAIAIGARAEEIHVATNGYDTAHGNASDPFRTIQHAAEVAQPGDVITVHGGVYRERINPPRGGESDAKRIVYQAAPGERVEIKGSEVAKGWTKCEGDVWKVALPNSFFGKFNPYSDLIRGDWFNPKGREHHTGAVYLNGDWLIEAAKLDDVLNAGGQLSYEEKGGCLLNVAWFQPAKGAKMPATKYVAQNGVKNAPCTEGGECIGWIENGDWASYDNVDFGADAESIEIRAASVTGGGVIEIRDGSSTGELLGTCAVADTGDWQAWQSFTAKIKPVSGSKKLCMLFRPPLSTKKASPLWFAKVEGDSTTIWAQFKGVDPNKELVEINARQTVFYPDKPGRNFITVRGFTMEHAATPWAPPTAEQPGLIGTHWSKGWIIESNIVRYSKCSGIALGKHGDQFDNTSANSAEGYVKTIERAHAFTIPWTKENVGGHIVRNNHISHCEQTGIVGSMGCAFSTVTGNVIHDIYRHKLFTGAEMGGIKFHASIDVVISGNHIYRSGTFGIWLDWMAQGTQVSGNLLHDNGGQDLFMEVDHGPYVIANNIILSQQAHLANSRGGAYVHNLVAGNQRIAHDNRETPFHKAHSTEVVALHNCPIGDARWINNILFSRCNLNAYDKAPLPVTMAGNVFLKGSAPGQYEAAPLIKPDFDPGAAIVEKEDGWYLDITLDQSWRTEQPRKLVTGELLGKAQIPNLPFENRDGSPLRIDTDYFGKKRDAANPFPGPFEISEGGKQTIKVWPK